MTIVRSSSVLSVKRALLVLLQGAPELDAALVRMGLPAEEPTETERAYVLPNLVRDYRDLAQQGARAEAYSVPIRIESKVYDANVDALEERLETLVRVVFDLVDADPELGGACQDAIVDTVDGPATGPTTDGWFGTCTVTVRVESWL